MFVAGLLAIFLLVLPLVLFFGSKVWGVLLPWEFFGILEVCFFIAASIMLLMCCSMFVLALPVDISLAAIAMASVTVVISADLNFTESIDAAFLFCFLCL